MPIRPESISPMDALQKATSIGPDNPPKPMLGMMPIGTGILGTKADIPYWLSMLARRKTDEIMGQLPSIALEKIKKLIYPEQPIPDVHPRSLPNAR